MQLFKGQMVLTKVGFVKEKIRYLGYNRKGYARTSIHTSSTTFVHWNHPIYCFCDNYKASASFDPGGPASRPSSYGAFYEYKDEVEVCFLCSDPHALIVSRTGTSVFPYSVNEYSTFGGTCG